MKVRFSYALEDALLSGWQEIKRVHWIAMIAGLAAAYLFYYYAGIYAELNKPPSFIVFIGSERLP